MKDIVDIKNAVDSLSTDIKLKDKDFKLLVAHISEDETICSLTPIKRKDVKGILVLTTLRMVFLAIESGNEFKWAIENKNIQNLILNADELTVVDIAKGKHFFSGGSKKNLEHMIKAFRLIVKEEKIDFEIFREFGVKKKKFFGIF